MALTVNLTPGAVVTEGDLWTAALLNLLANPTVELEGSVSAASIADNSITLAKLVDGILAASAAGRAKMADGYLTLAKLADGILSADATGRLKMADAFLTYAKLATDAKTTGAPARGDFSALVVANNVATPNSKVDVAATDLIVKDASVIPVCLTSVALTGVDITASGANGLDTGAEAGNTWYFIWVIYNPTTVTTAGLISASATAPTMPAGYTYKALVGAVRNDGSSNFVGFWQEGREVFQVTQNVITNTAPALADTYESLSLAAYVPTIAKVALGVMGMSNTANNSSMAVASDAAGIGAQAVAGFTTTDLTDGFSMCAPFRTGLKTAQAIFWKGGTASAWFRVSVSGWCF